MKTKRKGMSYAKWGYIFLAPFFITFFIFQFWPLATTIYYSFFEYFRSGLKIIGPNFVGLKNYAAMIKEVPKYFSNTMIMWLMGFIPQIIVSLVLAAWFTDLRLKLRFQGFFKTVIYMPNLIMASAFAMLFFTLFSNAETGPINSILLKLGIVAEPVRWLSNVWTARGLVGLMNFLMWFGNTTIILMAAIMGVDPGLYEAAQLDGASSTTMFWRITGFDQRQGRPERLDQHHYHVPEPAPVQQKLRHSRRYLGADVPALRGALRHHLLYPHAGG